MKNSHQHSACEPVRVTRQRESLAGRIIAAQEAERARIARDLHDDICQQLTLLALDLQPLRTVSQAVAAETIDAALQKLDQIIADTHSLSHRLHPSIVRELGVIAAMKAECRHFSERYCIPVKFTCRAPVTGVAEENGLVLFRILQEALHNVAKHARASDVQVSLDQSRDHLWLRVQDSGIGFDPGQTQRGLGLASMRERVALAQGTVWIHSAPGRGTLVE